MHNPHIKIPSVHLPFLKGGGGGGGGGGPHPNFQKEDLDNN